MMLVEKPMTELDLSRVCGGRNQRRDDGYSDSRWPQRRPEYSAYPSRTGGRTPAALDPYWAD